MQSFDLFAKSPQLIWRSANGCQSSGKLQWHEIGHQDISTCTIDVFEAIKYSYSVFKPSNGCLYGMPYRQTSNISRTLVGNTIVDHSDVVGATPVGAAPTTSSLSTSHLASMDWTKATEKQDEKHLRFGIRCVVY